VVIPQAKWQREQHVPDAVEPCIMQTPLISVVITAHNEGDELGRTIQSIRENTEAAHEIILVDDGSTDGSCEPFRSDAVRLISHPTRVGVAYSRHEGSLATRGDAIAYLDGHQRLSHRCLDQCAELAIREGAIVWPDVCGFEAHEGIVHGAYFTMSPARRVFAAEWKVRRPSRPVTAISSLRIPGYVIPRSVYHGVSWIRSLRGWGASEAAVSLKAFFTGVEILHLCGPVAKHQFKKSFNYRVRSAEVWRNQALIARVCFDDRTWHDYWLPEVFEAHLSDEVRRELESDVVQAEHEEFGRIKICEDRDFWTSLIFRELPAMLR
jgi:glycosyltransferase involved in cell wall biosynthesis